MKNRKNIKDGKKEKEKNAKSYLLELKAKNRNV